MRGLEWRALGRRRLSETQARGGSNKRLLCSRLAAHKATCGLGLDLPPIHS